MNVCLLKFKNCIYVLDYAYNNYSAIDILKIDRCVILPNIYTHTGPDWSGELF